MYNPLPFYLIFAPLLTLSITTKIEDKQDDFNFEIVNFPFLDGDGPRSPSFGVYMSQLICFAGVCSHVYDSTIETN